MIYTFAEAEAIENDPIRITLAGHTKAGKSAWLKSFLDISHDDKFIRIGSEPDTTRKIQGRSMMLPESDNPYLYLYDVPGQNWAGRLLQAAKKNYPRPSRSDLLNMVKHMRQKAQADSSVTASPTYLMDVDLLEHFASCDLVLFVVDCSNEPSEDDLDEFELVRRLAVPVIIVLNFSSENGKNVNSDVKKWELALAPEGPVDMVRYDAFRRAYDADDKLKNCVLFALGRRSPLKRKFAEYYWGGVNRKRHIPLEDSSNILAEFMVNAASCRRIQKGEQRNRPDKVRNEEDALRKDIAKHQKEMIRAMENAFDLPPDSKLTAGYQIGSDTLGVCTSKEKYRVPLLVGFKPGWQLGAAINPLVALLFALVRGCVMLAVGLLLSILNMIKLFSLYDKRFGKLTMRLSDAGLGKLAGQNMELIANLFLMGKACDRALPKPAGGVDKETIEEIILCLKTRVRHKSRWCKWINGKAGLYKQRSEFIKNLSERICEGADRHARFLDN